MYIMKTNLFPLNKFFVVFMGRYYSLIQDSLPVLRSSFQRHLTLRNEVLIVSFHFYHSMNFIIQCNKATREIHELHIRYCVKCCLTKSTDYESHITFLRTSWVDLDFWEAWSLLRIRLCWQANFSVRSRSFWKSEHTQFSFVINKRLDYYCWSLCKDVFVKKIAVLRKFIKKDLFPVAFMLLQVSC